MTPGRPGAEKAAWHYYRALSYRQDARLLLEQGRNQHSAVLVVSKGFKAGFSRFPGIPPSVHLGSLRPFILNSVEG